MLLFLSYLYAAWVGQGLAIIPGIDITFWPPAGLMLGTLLLTRSASWPWWLMVGVAGEFSANAFWFHNPAHYTMIYALGNVGEVLLGALLFRKLSERPRRIESFQTSLSFIISAGVAPVVSATVIASVDAFLAMKHSFLEAFGLVWLGDSTGILAIAPLMLVTAQLWKTRHDIDAVRIVEPVLLIAGVVVVLFTAAYTFQHFAYAALPLLVWLAVRTRFAGVTVAITVLSIAASYISSHRLGLFADPDTVKLRIVFVQSFLGISALVSLLVAALAQQYAETLASLQEANRNLERNVEQRTMRMRESEQRLQLALDAAGSGTWSLDLDTQVPVWDTRFQDAHAIKPGDPVTIDTWINAIHPDDQQRVRAQLERLNSPATSDTWESEYRVRHPEVGDRWLLTVGRIIQQQGEKPTGLSGIFLDITFRKTHEQRLRMLMRESSHRKKNLLAVVLAVARNTVADAPDDFLQRFQARIHALAAGYDVLINNAWTGVKLHQLIGLQLAHFEDLIGKRIFLEGPDLKINASAAQPLGMALHELSTNASKYGSLATPEGEIHVRWEMEDTGKPDVPCTFRMSWTESGGPRVVRPRRRGFGTAVTERMIQTSFAADVTLDYRPEGVFWTMACPCDQVLETDDTPKQDMLFPDL